MIHLHDRAFSGWRRLRGRWPSSISIVRWGGGVRMWVISAIYFLLPFREHTHANVNANALNLHVHMM